MHKLDHDGALHLFVALCVRECICRCVSLALSLSLSLSLSRCFTPDRSDPVDSARLRCSNRQIEDFGVS